MSHAGDADVRSCIFVVGTRAQLIKIAPVIRACETRGLAPVLLMTGQHLETIDDLLLEFGLETEPRWLDPPGEHATVRSLLRWAPRAQWRLLRHLRVLAAGRPGIDVVVHGDTLSTLLGAIAARFARARVLHVESGLSSGRLFTPFPEELIRRIVFRFTDVAFCPDEAASARMQTFGCEVVCTWGNTIIDAVHVAVPASAPTANAGTHVVASIHRFENIFGAARFRQLLDMLERIARRRTVHFVLHPATRKRLEESGRLAALQSTPGLQLTPRLGYGDFIRLAAGSACVITDGGSNQEELAVLGVPTVIMRSATERSDGLGGNAIMEAEVECAVDAWLERDGHERLRRSRMPTRDTGPSASIAAWIDARSRDRRGVDETGRGSKRR